MHIFKHQNIFQAQMRNLGERNIAMGPWARRVWLEIPETIENRIVQALMALSISILQSKKKRFGQKIGPFWTKTMWLFVIKSLGLEPMASWFWKESFYH